MQLNLLPCYQVVYSEGAYFLCIWKGFQYEIREITREKPECVGNCVVFYDKASSSPSQKRYRLWWIDEDEGCCLCDTHSFDKWMYHEGNFLCCHQYSKETSEEWGMVMPDEKKRELLNIALGQMICDKFMCFVCTDENQRIILSSFPRGYAQHGIRQQAVIDDYLVVNGSVWYRIGDDVFYSSEFSLPDGSKGWRFVKDSDGLENWESLKSEK